VSDYSEPPQHLAPVDDEQAVLGACLLSEQATTDLLATIPAGAAFYRFSHEQIWDAIVAVHERGERADTLNVNAELHRMGVLSKIGGPAYLHTLMTACTAPSIAGTYAGRVLDAWELRRAEKVMIQGRQLIHAADGGPVAEVLDAIEAELQAARAGRLRVVAPSYVGELVDEVLAALDPVMFDEELPGLTLPWADLNKLVNPMTGGQVLCVAARPAIGKSTWLVNLLEHVAFNLGRVALLVSWEMKRREIVPRVIAHQAKVPLHNLIRGPLRPEDHARIASYREALDSAPLLIEDDPSMSLAGVDRLIRQYKPAVVGIDYLQIAVPDGNANERRALVEKFSRGIKLLAGHRDVPIVVASQLNRGPESRKDHKPQMSDLRESGALEQDFDTIMLLHREDAYEPESPRAGELDVIVAKQRNGATDTITLASQLHYARFLDLAT
jgi:replicative DNA helicase